MANEAVIVELLGNEGEAVDFTVADGVAISKGTLMSGGDLRVASASAGTADVFVGVAAADKEASDGATNLALYTHGIFDMTVNAGTAVTAGAMVVLSGANLIRDAIAEELLTGAVIGQALETGSTSEVIEVLVNK